MPRENIMNILCCDFLIFFFYYESAIFQYLINSKLGSKIVARDLFKHSDQRESTHTCIPYFCS